MTKNLDGVSAEDGAPVPAGEIPIALTAGRLVYTDRATQTFDPDGATRYAEGGRETEGTWSVDENGHFCSFWPPSYRASYDLRWVVEGGRGRRPAVLGSAKRKPLRRPVSVNAGHAPGGRTSSPASPSRVRTSSSGFRPDPAGLGIAMGPPPGPVEAGRIRPGIHVVRPDMRTGRPRRPGCPAASSRARHIGRPAALGHHRALAGEREGHGRPAHADGVLHCSWFDRAAHTGAAPGRHRTKAITGRDRAHDR